MTNSVSSLRWASVGSLMAFCLTGSSAVSAGQGPSPHVTLLTSGPRSSVVVPLHGRPPASALVEAIDDHSFAVEISPSFPEIGDQLLQARESSALVDRVRIHTVAQRGDGALLRIQVTGKIPITGSVRVTQSRFYIDVEPQRALSRPLEASSSRGASPPMTATSPGQTPVPTRSALEGSHATKERRPASDSIAAQAERARQDARPSVEPPTPSPTVPVATVPVAPVSPAPTQIDPFDEQLAQLMPDLLQAKELLLSWRPGYWAPSSVPAMLRSTAAKAESLRPLRTLEQPLSELSASLTALSNVWIPGPNNLLIPFQDDSKAVERAMDAINRFLDAVALRARAQR